MTPEVLKLILQITSMAMVLPSSVADVFLDWAPHCETFSMRIYRGGWEKGKAAEYTDLFFNNGDIVERLQSVLATLKALPFEVGAKALELIEQEEVAA